MKIKSKTNNVYSKFIVFKVNRVVNEEIVDIEYSNNLSNGKTVKVSLDTNQNYNNNCYRYIQYVLCILPHKMVESTFIILGNFDEAYEYNENGYVQLYPTL